MKTPFLVALAGLAIGFAVPTLAEQTVDPQVREQIDAHLKKETRRATTTMRPLRPRF